MSNWVNLQITGVSESIAEKYIDKTGNFDFNRLIPMPESLISLIDIDNKEIQNWRYNNWGSEDNAYDTIYDKYNNTLYFSTKQNIPESVLKKITIDNPDITLNLYAEYEEGAGTYLKAVLSKGEFDVTEKGELNDKFLIHFDFDKGTILEDDEYLLE